MKISQAAMKNLARYIIRALLSQGRMTYFPEESKVVYRSKDGKEEKIFDALEWLVPPTGGILMCQTRENRWSGTMAITVPPRDGRVLLDPQDHFHYTPPEKKRRLIINHPSIQNPAKNQIKVPYKLPLRNLQIF